MAGNLWIHHIGETMEQEEIKVRLAIVDLALVVLTTADDDPRKNGAIEIVLKHNNFLTIVERHQVSNFVVELSKIFDCDYIMMTYFML